MARFVGGDFAEERPETEMSEEFRNWYETTARERWTENRKRDRADPLFPREIGKAWGFGAGIPFPVPEMTPRIRITKLPGDILPDFLGPLYVSDRVRSKVEEMEPGVHQFLPLEVEMPDGSTLKEKYCIWCNMNVLDSIILDRSENLQQVWPNRDQFPEYYRYGETANGPPVLALNKALIAGKVKWSEYKLGKIFFSDEFAAWLDAKGIMGWESDGFFGSRRATIIEV
ncbi:DUF1629 domain-containing protein [Novosphingobium beihaiensis]|uniref:DUF1629 domain-containing protein n=1 Tax=Novosphingobium beihaiensis TaxID=2930389 RepID=A0ABT0BSE7_9SPHN|nr:DUF1629 domain-containing protein [Novosphingobium beihaiensis]MCJ2187711.1 DUF1629 domain-containing protein [Novosphingobium beihaiensis]